MANKIPVITRRIRQPSVQPNGAGSHGLPFGSDLGHRLKTAFLNPQTVGRLYRRARMKTEMIDGGYVKVKLSFERKDRVDCIDVICGSKVSIDEAGRHEIWKVILRIFPSGFDCEMTVASPRHAGELRFSESQKGRELLGTVIEVEEGTGTRRYLLKMLFSDYK